MSSTQLGQPLNFTSVVNLEGDESLTRECVFAEVVAGDIRIAPGFVRVLLENGSSERERVVRVSTSTPIDEPVVAISVSLGCASRTTRRFVEFVDPPGIALAQSAPVAAEPAAPPARNDTGASASNGAAPADPERTGGSASADRADGPMSSPRHAAAAAATPAGSSRSPASPGGRRVASAPRQPSVIRQAAVTSRGAAAGARLQLDAPSVAVAAPPAASEPPAPAVADAIVAAASAPARSSASEAEAQAALLDQERRRVRSLEEAVSRLQADAQVQRQALAALQIRTRGTRSERYANPFVYTLAALCLLLTMTVCGLLGRRSRDRAAARWLTGPVPGEAAANGRAADPAEGVSVAPPLLTSEPVSPSSSVTAPAATPVAGRVAPSGPGSTSAADLGTAGSAGSSTSAPARQDGAEELVDLEQQADFFIVLGQDDAAIELLRNHADAGPLPLLKLMEIHRRLGDRAEYEKVRSRVLRHFNADAPKWQEADAGEERSLEDYPEVLARIRALWARPAAAMQALDALMFRRGAEDAGFDLPAYRELMLLHSIARDRDAGEDSGRASASRAVDLLLPIGPAAAHASIARLSPTADAASRLPPPAPVAPARLRVPIPALPGRGGAVVESSETIPSALRRAPGYANESAFVDLELEFPGLPTAPRSG